VPYLWRRSVIRGDGIRPDVVGAAIVAVAVTGLVLLVQSPSAGTTTAVVGAVLLALGVPATAGWVRRRPDGFLPRAVIRNSDVVRSSLCAAVVPVAWFALLLGIPLELAERGWTPLSTGLVLVPSALVALACPSLSAILHTRVGARRTLAAACATTTVGLVVAVAGVTWHLPWLLAVAPMLVTLAFGTGQPAMMAAVGVAVPDERRSGSIGVATLCFLTGAGIGAATIGGIAPVLGLPAAFGLLAAAALAVSAVAGYARST